MLSPSQSQPCTLATDLGVIGAQTVFPFVFTNPLAGSTQLSNVIIELTTSAVVATRRILFTVTDDVGARRLSLQGRGIQLASSVVEHPFVQGETFLIAFGLTVTTSIPRGFYLRKDWVLSFGVTNVQLGDSQRVLFQLLR